MPKTIDKDLLATETTFGFDTALRTVTESLDMIHTTAESHERVMIVEVMGRNSGWIALEAGIAGGADIILIPEIPFAVEKMVEKIEARRQAGPALQCGRRVGRRDAGWRQPGLPGKGNRGPVRQAWRNRRYRRRGCSAPVSSLKPEPWFWAPAERREPDRL